MMEKTGKRLNLPQKVINKNENNQLKKWILYKINLIFETIKIFKVERYCDFKVDFRGRNIFQNKTNHISSQQIILQ